MNNITIAIPTYGRIDSLRRRVQELLPQMDGGDRLYIFDNATEGFEPKLIPELQDSRVVLTINHVNVGGNANITKCISCVSSGWLWLLSDDDSVKDGAVKSIKEIVSTRSECCFISFCPDSKGFVREKSLLATGLAEFLQLNDGFQWTLLMSNCVFNLDKIATYLKSSYTSIWMNCPHLAPVINCLQDGGRALYSEKSLVVWRPPNLKKSWSIVPVYNLLQLCSLVSDPADAKSLRKVISKGLPSKFRFTLEVCASQARHGKDWRALPYAATVLWGLSRDKGILNKLMFLCLFASLVFPRFSIMLFESLYFLAKRRRLGDTLQDRPFKLYL